jgi:hypothetical protein
MLLMGIGALLYENERNDNISMILISLLLIGIYGLITINETNDIHYIFTGLVFISILCFMIRHLTILGFPSLLILSLSLELVALIYIVFNIKENIFFAEVFYILNFAFFYLYLHFLCRETSVSPIEPQLNPN